MATVEELIKQYDEDPEVQVSLAELPEYLEKAKELGLIK